MVKIILTSLLLFPQFILGATLEDVQRWAEQAAQEAALNPEEQNRLDRLKILAFNFATVLRGQGLIEGTIVVVSEEGLTPRVWVRLDQIESTSIERNLAEGESVVYDGQKITLKMSESNAAIISSIEIDQANLDSSAVTFFGGTNSVKLTTIPKEGKTTVDFLGELRIHAKNDVLKSRASQSTSVNSVTLDQEFKEILDLRQVQARLRAARQFVDSEDLTQPLKAIGDVVKSLIKDADKFESPGIRQHLAMLENLEFITNLILAIPSQKREKFINEINSVQTILQKFIEIWLPKYNAMTFNRQPIRKLFAIAANNVFLTYGDKKIIFMGTLDYLAKLDLDLISSEYIQQGEARSVLKDTLAAEIMKAQANIKESSKSQTLPGKCEKYLK